MYLMRPFRKFNTEDFSVASNPFRRWKFNNNKGYTTYARTDDMLRVPPP
jgi:hypothetical protein